MKTPTAIAVLAIVALAAAASAQTPYGEAGFNLGATVIEGQDPACPGELVCNWDGTPENAYCWQLAGVVPPDYGSFADCYDAAFVCDAYFYFTLANNYYAGQTYDAYVWENDGGLPGNVVCSSVGNVTGPIAVWPECSTHTVTLNCDAPDHFIGFWGNWPGDFCGWFVCGDETGPASCPVTKIAPGIDFPDGWRVMTDGPVPTLQECQSLGICEWVGEPSATAQTTWGQIKSLY